MTAGRAGLGGPKAREGRARKFSTDPARQGVAMPNVTGHSPLFQLGGGTTIQLPKLAAGGRGSGLNSAAVGGCHISQSGPEKTRAVTRKWEVEGAGPCDGREWAWPGELS